MSGPDGRLPMRTCGTAGRTAMGGGGGGGGGSGTTDSGAAGRASTDGRTGAVRWSATEYGSGGRLSIGGIDGGVFV